MAPFSWLAHRYGDDLAILRMDSDAHIGTPASEYPGFHAMAVAALTWRGDPDVRGIRSFRPDFLRESTEPVLAWLAATGCSRVAVHFDVDTA